MLENRQNLNTYKSLKALVIIVLLLPFCLSAQRPPNFNPGFGSGPPTTPQTTNQDTGPDSTIYDFIYLNDIFKKYKRTDTLADIAFMHNNMLVSKGGDHINTGNFGSSVYSLIFQPTVSTHFFSGYQQYKLYQLNSGNFRFYEQNRPLSDLYFSQLGNQENINVRADFSRNFSDGLSFCINFARISQKGFFTGQEVKNTGFGVGLRYKSPKDTYNAFLLFFHNANEESHIGGIINPEEIKNEFNKDLSIILSQANTRNQEQEIALIQNLKLTGKHKSGFQVYLKNDLKIRPSYFKFSDSQVNDGNDSTFYKGIQTDIRGIRRYVDVDHISNGFFIHGEKSGGINTRVGLIADYFNINDGLGSNKRLDLTATFDGRLPLLKSLFIETNGKLGIGKNIGSFDFGGKLNINIGKIGILTGNVRFFRSENPYNASRLVINDVLQFDKDFSKPFGTEFGGDIHIKKLKLKATLSQTVINNPIYFGIDGMPIQSDDVFSSTRLSLMHQLKVWKISLDNQAHFQVFSSNIYALPSFYSTHQLYYTGAWFKKEMMVNTGFDVRLIPDYKGPGFHPLYGAFHTTSTDLNFFPAANFFFLARVSAFRAMILFENVSQSLVQDHNFDVVGHPQNEMKIRFGIQWLLKD